MRPAKYEIGVSPVPTLLLGMSSAVDPFGSVGLRVHFDLPESVEEALARDWQAVYGDVSASFDRITKGTQLP